MTENAAGKQRGRPFPKGQSGNPAGKPKGCRHRATRAAEALLDGEAEALTRKAIEAAKSGDVKALRLCLDRLLPPRRERLLPPLKLPVPEEGRLGDVARAVFQAAAAGELTPSEAAAYGALLDGIRKSVELDEVAQRLARLEAAMDQENKA